MIEAQVSADGSNSASLKKLTVRVGILTVIVVSFIGFWLTFLSPLFSPCVPAEAASDSGAALAFVTVSMLIWFVAGPLAVLFGTLLSYGSVRWFKFGGRRSYSILAGIAAGGLSGLVFSSISFALLNWLLCMD